MGTCACDQYYGGSKCQVDLTAMCGPGGDLACSGKVDSYGNVQFGIGGSCVATSDSTAVCVCQDYTNPDFPGQSIARFGAHCEYFQDCWGNGVFDPSSQRCSCSARMANLTGIVKWHAELFLSTPVTAGTGWNADCSARNATINCGANAACSGHGTCTVSTASANYGDSWCVCN